MVTDAPTAGPAPVSRPAERVLSLDAARGLAVVAMVVAHGLPWITPLLSSLPNFVLAQVNDTASPLFALVMGISAGLVFPGPSAGRGFARALVRGLALVALGVGLEQFDHWAAVILHILGVLLIVGTPLLLLGTRWLLGVALALVAISPFVITAVTRAGGGEPGGLPPTADWASNPLVEWLVLNTHYRVLTLLPLFLLGAVLARRGLRDERAAWWCLIGGLTMAWLSYALELLGVAVVFSGDFPDQLQENGLALAAYGLVTVVALGGEGRADGVGARLLRPVALIGRVALSLYVGHVLFLVPLIDRWPSPDWTPFVIFVVGCLVVSWAWARFIGPGPIEWLLDRISPSRRPPAASQVRSRTPA